MHQGSHSSHRAQYDADGNIILPSDNVAPVVMPQYDPLPAEPAHVERSPIEHAFDAIHWGLPDDEPTEDISSLPVVQRERTARRIADRLDSVRASCVAALEEVQDDVIDTTKQALREGERQLLSGFHDSISVSHGVVEELRQLVRAFRRFVTQPVLVPGRKKTIKQHSRGALFLLDIARFGGTFAAIFTVLFSAMNYESFLSIASARIEPILAFTQLDASASIEESLAEKLREVPSLPTAGDAPAGLAAHLPPVGPPEDVLIIPRLGLHAPIISPSTDSLLREDWKQLENDIQDSLEDGVVHYPGTAEPGQAGNFFVTGHSSYFPWAEGQYKSIFARLGELAVGDEFWVYHGGDKYRYVIDLKKEIYPSDVSVLDQPTGKRMATLMTCTPVGTTLRRLIITAQEVDPVTGEPMDIGKHQSQPDHPALKLDALPI